MDPAYISALAALAGSLIGGMTSFGTSWLSKRVEFTSEQLAHGLIRREELYRDFIEEASRWYAHAYEHNDPALSNFVHLYALVSQMRVLSNATIVESADTVVRRIIETYRAPNQSFATVEELIDDEAMNPLAAFANACREELRAFRP
jgi:hypothetical protein